MAEPNIFRAEVAYDIPTKSLLPGAVADVYADDDTTFSTPLTLTELGGAPMAQLVANDQGVFPPFKVDSPDVHDSVIAKSGSYTTVIVSTSGNKGDPGDEGPAGEGIPPLSSGTPGQVVRHGGDAAVWGDEASGGGGGVSSWNDLTDKPSSFPPASHTHTSGGISDSTPVGRQVLTAADPQAARQAIGAGTGNGTSNLTIGTSSTQAAPGNHTHAASTLGWTPPSGWAATDVQAAIEEAGNRGGSGGSNTMYRYYASGQYPALPATKPAGVERIEFEGPVIPNSGNVAGGLPSYIGNGSTQIKTHYEFNGDLT